MPVNLNLGDLLKAITDKSTKDNRYTAEYLKHIADQADELAKVWQSVYTQFCNGMDSVTIKDRNWQFLRDPNAGLAHRLFAFYRDISTALGGKYKYQEHLVAALGSLLQYRNITKDAFHEAIRKASMGAGDPDIEDLGKHIESLHQAAATLHVLARRFR